MTSGQQRLLDELLEKMFNHHPTTFAHMNNVKIFAYRLARRLGYAEDHAQEIGRAGLLHDIGKLLISPRTLDAPRALTDTEWEAMREHPIEGARLARGRIGDLAIVWIEQHHERLDGSGYPKHLKGRDVLHESRVLATVDMWDALIARPYQPFRNDVQRAQILADNRVKLGEDIVDAFLEMVGASLESTLRADVQAYMTAAPALQALD